jgi:prevent-host-death family protein
MARGAAPSWPTCTRDQPGPAFDKVVSGDYLRTMNAVNIKELKARLSAFLREVQRGETFLVTDRGRVIARLGPPDLEREGVGRGPAEARLAALGVRLPLRARRPQDYARPGPGSGLSTKEIDELLDWVRGEKA